MILGQRRCLLFVGADLAAGPAPGGESRLITIRLRRGSFERISGFIAGYLRPLLPPFRLALSKFLGLGEHVLHLQPTRPHYRAIMHPMNPAQLRSPAAEHPAVTKRRVRRLPIPSARVLVASSTRSPRYRRRLPFPLVLAPSRLEFVGEPEKAFAVSRWLGHEPDARPE